MKHLKISSWVAVVFLLILGPISALTLDDTCSQIVSNALEMTDQICDPTGRNQACYGHIALQAEPQPTYRDAFSFSEVGDRVEVTALKSLRLSAMDTTQGVWGVALMNIQANLPEDLPNQNVTFLMFGDVEMENAIPLPTNMNVTVTSQQRLNVHNLPNEAAYVFGTLDPNETVQAVGRTADRQWVFVEVPGMELEHGWVFSGALTAPDELQTLNIIDPRTVDYGPMQAFYLKTGDNPENLSCAEAPDNGLLIQTPEGAGQIRLMINEVRIGLGSTAFIQSKPGEAMTIATLEGKAEVEAMGVQSTAFAGTQVTVPLGTDSRPVGPPSRPQGYEVSQLQQLPVRRLARQISIHQPLTPEEIATMEVQPSSQAPVTQLSASPEPEGDETVALTTQSPTRVLPTLIGPTLIPGTPLPTQEPTSPVTDQPSPTDDPGEGTQPVTPTDDNGGGTDEPSPTDVRPTDRPTDEQPSETPPNDDDDGNNGHGNDDDGNDDGNPGNGNPSNPDRGNGDNRPPRDDNVLPDPVSSNLPANPDNPPPAATED
jgi:hypothetical protein